MNRFVLMYSMNVMEQLHTTNTFSLWRQTDHTGEGGSLDSQPAHGGMAGQWIQLPAGGDTTSLCKI